MRGPAKCFFHRPCWEIFAMVSIQIWVTRFHIRGTGEQRQVCLAAVTGCPFFPQGQDSSTKYNLWQEMFLYIAFHEEMTPPSRLLPMSNRSPRTVPRGNKTCCAPAQHRQKESESPRENRYLCQPGMLLQHAHENKLFHIECALAFKAVIMDD